MLVSIILLLIVGYLLYLNAKRYFLPPFVKLEIIRQGGSELDLAEYIKLNEQITSVTNCISDTDAEIKSLTVDLQDLTNTLTSTTAIINDLNAQIANITNEIDNANNAITQMEDISTLLRASLICLILSNRIKLYIYTKLKTAIELMAYLLRITTRLVNYRIET